MAPPGPQPNIYNHPYGSHNAYPQPPPIRRPSHRSAWWFTIIRPWVIVVPFVTIITVIWWYATGRVCDSEASVSDECFWILWLSLPLSVVSILWNIAATISSRRIAHHRPGISSDVQLPVQSVIACGATICLALLAWHLASYMDRMWGHALEGGMVALVAIIALANWLLVVFTAHEWILDRRQQHQENYVL